MQTTEPVPQQLSPVARRVRRYRERRQAGEVCVSCVLRHGFIRALVDYGWLPFDQQDDRGAIATAFRGFVARALAVARNGGYDRWNFGNALHRSATHPANLVESERFWAANVAQHQRLRRKGPGIAN